MGSSCHAYPSSCRPIRSNPARRCRRPGSRACPARLAPRTYLSQTSPSPTLCAQHGRVDRDTRARGRRDFRSYVLQGMTAQLHERLGAWLLVLIEAAVGSCPGFRAERRTPLDGERLVLMLDCRSPRSPCSYGYVSSGAAPTGGSPASAAISGSEPVERSALQFVGSPTLRRPVRTMLRPVRVGRASAEHFAASQERRRLTVLRVPGVIRRRVGSL